MIKVKTGDQLVPLIRVKLMDILGRSLSTSMFKSSYFLHNGKVVDLCERGKFSCAFFVSFLLKAVGLIGELHLNISPQNTNMEDGEAISNFERDLLNNSWKRGDVNSFLNEIGPLKNSWPEARIMSEFSLSSENKNHVLCQRYPCSVVIWEPKVSSDNLSHRHVGFYFYNHFCVSTESKDVFQGIPTCEDVTYEGKRKIEKIYIHPRLVAEGEALKELCK